MVEERNFTEWKIQYVRYCRLQKKANSTIQTYWNSVGRFLNYFKNQNIERLNSNQIADYILTYDSSHTMEQKKFSIQLFYGVIFGQWQKLKWIPLPKRENKIPEILSVDECYKVFNCIENLKHRALIQFTYACALRRSELINTRIRHIDGSTSRLFIEQSKGAKDRIVPIPKDTLNLLREYFKQYFPDGYNKNDFLFQGKSKTKESYSAESVYAILKKAVQKAGIFKKIKLHSLRHSRATHWHNSGIMSLRDLADLLGHKNTKTSEIYLHTGDENLQEKSTIADQIIESKISPLLLQRYNQKQLVRD